MPARFARLRIAGFKSFADPVSIEILPGLTGIVGPNGCGKSNVVDALRWAMGESSAKSMRGGEMDDVIFAGTLSRPARGSAEVCISLADTAGLAPAPFQAEAELEISRKIERNTGSTYRVNGRETRARDVATLLADLASGARNSAMISQGRVSALVSARPDERRAILEEAAGITGLHARRHEAELKLRATEENLTRADDLRMQQETRLAALRQQASDATRYRELSAGIRSAETEYLAIEQALADDRRQLTRTALEAARAAVTTAQSARHLALATEARQTEALPALRTREGGARTLLERARVQVEQVEAETSRTRATRLDAQRQLKTLISDLEHAERTRSDAEVAQSRLAKEHQHLVALEAAAPSDVEAARQATAHARGVLDHAETEAQAAVEAAARITAARQAITSRLALARKKATETETRARQANQAHQRAIADLISPQRLANAKAAHEQAEATLQEAERSRALAQDVLDHAETSRAAAAAAASSARADAVAADSALAAIRIEVDALSGLLARKFGHDANPVLDQLKVPSGLENALAAALRDELGAGTSPEAARHWCQLPPVPARHSLTPLSTMIEFPAQLTRALDHILLLPDAVDGNDLHADLAPGETLVSKEGAIWRWDGFTARPGAPNEAAMRLAQRNRLAALQDGFAHAAARAATCKSERQTTELAEATARRAESEARTRCKDAEAQIDRARSASRALTEAAHRLEAEAERQATREASAAEIYVRLAAEHAEAVQHLATEQSEFDALADPRSAISAVEASRNAVQTARQIEAEARKRLDHLTLQAEQRKQRLPLIARELHDWQERSRDIASRITDLTARLTHAKAVITALPDDALLNKTREDARSAAEEAEAAHHVAATALAAAETDHQRSTAAARAAEQDVAAAREALIAAESALREADIAWGTVAERVLERLGAEPTLPVIENPAPQAAERARRRFDRLTRERDELGPVNLRAELELAEIEIRLSEIETERNEISSAIAKLRGSIGSLNREGRERLATVFTQIDRHFQSLFSRMFGGGRAHLALTGSDDPLQAGLEIFAEPPGKKLATLSLLSGGEQALTALSLIFAVFRCNPAPFSVLDEVDAPLDDANVDRFCTLLDDMSRETGTRFLVVTHHHHTMARMDRLYGITMQERGISRILSVDLGTATRLVAHPAEIAAE